MQAYKRSLKIAEKIYLKSYLLKRTGKLILKPTHTSIHVTWYGKFLDWAVKGIGSGTIQLNDQFFKD